jgi:alpha-glucosidase (family GH31 glycosyl hydrolase)
MLHAGVSGLTLTHSDLGGYTSLNEVIAGYPLLAINRSKELLLRWCELSAFTAVYRTHAGNLPSLNAQFWTDADTLAQFRWSER